MAFQEIAFKAELDRHVDPECEYQARMLCEEDPSKRQCIVEELRNMIYGKGTYMGCGLKVPLCLLVVNSFLFLDVASIFFIFY